MKNQILKKLFISILVIFISGIIGLILLTLAFIMPTKRIYDNVSKSASVVFKETDYYSITPTISGSTLDNYTDSIYLNEALVSAKDSSLWKSMMSGYLFSSNELSPSRNLANIFNNPSDYKLESNLSRFFNGYILFVKLLLFLTDISGIRQFNIFMVFLTLLLFCLLLNKRGFSNYIFPIIISLMFINLLAISLCMTFVGFYYCMIIPCIIMLIIKKETLIKYAWIFFEIIGICTFYFNMNYFQLLTFVLPFMIYMLIIGFPKNCKDAALIFIKLFVMWFIGYAGIMVFKWLLYALTLKPDMFKEMINSVLFRTSVNRGSRLFAISKNIKIGFGNIWWNAIEETFILFQVIKHLKNKTKIKIRKVDLFLLFVMMCMPICRYFILANHVIIHSWVTYRLIMIPILVFNIILVKIGDKKL